MLSVCLERDVVVGRSSGGHGSGLEVAGVGRDVALRRGGAAGEAVPTDSVFTPAEELHGFSDDID
jgi:hypothetical protein